ncbi:MAG: Gldg family protein [Gammaproteobacteria bacterium]|nr:MAG: Gldg family protein [Gammaproteobacteria bacterium]
MRIDPASRLRIRIQGIVFYVLVAAVVGLLGWLSMKHTFEWDFSVGKRNTLSMPSQTLLARMQGPLEIIAYARPSNTITRDIIRELVEKYQRYKPDITLQFKNPDSAPQEVRDLGITMDGELLVRYENRSERVRQQNEQRLSNALFRLMRQQQRWIVFLKGHGERRFDTEANHDMGDFGRELKRKGLILQDTNLAKTQSVPGNTSVLVIASPQVDLLPGEIDLIQQYIEAGGNLLWLTEPGPQHGLEAVAEQLALSILPGVVVDASTQLFGITNPTFALVADYEPHPVTRALSSFTIFPESAAIEHAQESDWQSQRLLATLSRSWTETGALSGEIRFDEANNERAGPLSIGLALTRTLDAPSDDNNAKTREQRIVVIGDGDFLTNRYVGNGANLDLGLSVIQWLAHDDQLLDIPARTSPDLTLDLSRNAAIIISIGFIVILPLGLLVAGITIWLRRRKR